MRWSQAFIPTLREDPAGAESTSHRLLLRAGYVRQLGAGLYSLLPLAVRVRAKMVRIIREELNKIGAQEFSLPAMHPAELWQESGRLATMGDIMFKLRDRKGCDMVLGTTHEEVFASIARTSLQSYRQLPQLWYQFQTKYRDEPRPKSGLLRVREFTMKDSYSFDVDSEGLDKSFDLHDAAYRRIFERCSLKFLAVQASSGAMGGSQSIEFMLKTDAGEDFVVKCSRCGYAANLEKAVSRPKHAQPDAQVSTQSAKQVGAQPAKQVGAQPDTQPAFPSASEPDSTLAEVQKFHTPGVRTIDQLAAFEGGAQANRQIKTLVFRADGKLIIALVRGDHQLNVTKLSEAIGASEVIPASDDEILSALGASAGSLGAVGLTKSTHPLISQIFADESLMGASNMQTGANENDYHLCGVSVQRDISVDRWLSLRDVQEGDLCTRCGASLEIFKALEIGHIFKLGTRYSESMGVRVLNRDGQEVPVVMGSYGIGVERLMAAIVESSHDDQGIIWPDTVAPYSVVITVVNSQDVKLAEAAEEMYRTLEREGIDVILDDRNERAGVKFADADLVGIPYRITVGKKAKDNIVEIFTRKTKASLEIDIADLVTYFL